MATKKYTVELTLNEIIVLRDVVRAAHEGHAYYARKRLDDENEGGWQHTETVKARAAQATLSAVHVSLTGDLLEPTPEDDPKPVDES